MLRKKDEKRSTSLVRTQSGKLCEKRSQCDNFSRVERENGVDGFISRIAPFQALEVGAFAHKERVELFLHLQYTGPVDVDGFPRLSVR